MKRALVALALMAATAACGPVITITRDASIPIAPNATFAWGVADGSKNRTQLDPRVDNDSIRGRVERAVESELVARGFRKVAYADAQLLVHYHLGVETHVDSLVLDTPCPGATCHDPKYAWGYWGEPEVPIREVRYVSGRLMLDVLARPSLKVAWRGIAEDEVTRKSATLEKIRAIVTRLIKQFPAGP